jgi:hypothetical protein
VTIARARFLAARAVVAVAVVAVAAAGAPAGQQRPRRTEDPEKAKGLVERALAALGSEKFLAVTSEVGVGTFTPFDQGRRGVPSPFEDIFVYPDKNRTEFGKKKTRVVQSNTGTVGWKYDAARESLEDQTETETAAFQRFVRAHAGNVLRRFWREPGVKLHYIGREEIAPREYAEGVAVEYPDGFEVELLFDRAGLPVVSRYREGSESGAPGSLVETRYFMYIDLGGVMAPRIVDLYRDQVQTARIVYDSVTFNAPVAPTVFDRPESAKSLK